MHTIGRIVIGVAVAAALAAAASPASRASAAGIPLGDGHAGAKAPKRGGFYACFGTKTSKAGRAPWVTGRRWFPTRRPVVGGEVLPEGQGFALPRRGGGYALRGAGVPQGHAIGAFPAAPSDPAAGYAAATRTVVPHALSGRIPRPETRAKPSCVGRGPLGVALDGAAILPPTDRSGRDLGAYEVVDGCGGTVEPSGLYGYRRLPGCIGGAAGSQRAALIGYARDGFGIYGQRGEDGRRLGNGDLDACHGHVGTVRDRGGKLVRRYHYHATAAFPYFLGCFRGRPARWRDIASPGPSETSIRSSPALFPGFSVDVSDYAVRCSGEPLSLGVETPDGTAVRVDGGAARSGSFAQAVPLSPGQEFTFSTERAGERRSYHARCLPPDFPQWTYQRFSRPSSALYLVTPAGAAGSAPYAAMFDRSGVPLWWYRSPDYEPIDAKLLSDGRIAWARRINVAYGFSPDGAYEIRGLDGSLKRLVTTVGDPTDFHELQELGNGNLLVLSYRPRDGVDLSAHGGPASATVLDSEIQEIDPGGGLVWSWNSRDHIAQDETGRWWPTVIATAGQLPDGRTVYDTTHINSVEPDGGKLILSFRHLDAVYAIDRSTGAVEWKLGGTTTPESLTVEDDPLAPQSLGGAHDARVLPDGSVTVHDNATGLGRAPRAVRYAVDPAGGTATLLESVSDPLVGGSICCGGARRVPGGSWDVSWGANGIVGEYAPDGSPVFRIGLGTTIFSYRVVPIADGVLDAAALRAGMDSIYPRP